MTWGRFSSSSIFINFPRHRNPAQQEDDHKRYSPTFGHHCFQYVCLTPNLHSLVFSDSMPIYSYFHFEYHWYLCQRFLLYLFELILIGDFIESAPASLWTSGMGYVDTRGNRELIGMAFLLVNQSPYDQLLPQLPRYNYSSIFVNHHTNNKCISIFSNRVTIINQHIFVIHICSSS